MALAFVGLPIPGTHTRAEASPPRIVAKRTHFAGLNGVVENLLGNEGRPLRYFITIHHPLLRTAAQITALLAQLDDKVGAHGVLSETGNITRTYKHVTFDGFEQTLDILRDYAGTLNGGTVGYFTQGYLNFYQLSAADG